MAVKEMDIQEASPNSLSDYSESSVDLKKRRVDTAASTEPGFIRKNINVMRDFRNLDGYEPEKIRAIEALQEILHDDEALSVDIMVSEGITSVLIEQINEFASPSGSDGDNFREVLEERALGLLTDLVLKKAEVGRDIITGGGVSRLFSVLRREHKHADDELPLRLKTLVFQTFEKLSLDWGDDLLEQEDYYNYNGVDIVRGLMSPNSGIQVLACSILSALGSSRLGHDRVSTSDCATQLSVMLSSKNKHVRFSAAGTIMALCFSEVENFDFAIGNFCSRGVLQPIVQMLQDSEEESASLAARLLSRFVRARTALTTTISLTGAVRPLVQMLHRPSLLKDAVVALDCLSITIHADFVGFQIILEGGLEALMSAFSLPYVQRDRELAPVLATLLFRVANFRDGIVSFIKLGGLRMIKTTKMHQEAVREAASIFSNHIGLVVKNPNDEYRAKSLFLAAREAAAGDDIRSCCVHALAVLTNPSKYGAIFLYHNFLEILLQIYGRLSNMVQHQEAAESLYIIAKRSSEFIKSVSLANDLNFVDQSDDLYVEEIVDEALVDQSDIAVPDPVPSSIVDLDFDVTFFLDNDSKQIRAHKRVLSEASQVFAALLADNYFKNTGGIIKVPNISFSTFESVIEFIYKGRLRPDIEPEEYYDIFLAADFYQLFSLKRVCEKFIARTHIIPEMVADVYDFAEMYHSKLLMHACILFLLEHHVEVRRLPIYSTLVEKTIPEIRRWFPMIIPGTQHGFMAPLSGQI